MAHPSTAAGEDDLVSVPVATWSGGTTVQSVVVSEAGRVEHEYWVVRAGLVLARFPSLAAVDAWWAQGPEIGLQPAA